MFDFKWKIRFYRQYILIAVSLVTFCAVMYFIDKTVTVSELQRTLQTDSIPTGLLEYGTRGKIIKRLNLFEIVENDGNRYPLSENQDSGLEKITFQKKRRVGSILFKVHNGTAASTTKPLKSGSHSHLLSPPVISINVDASYLFDKQIGIVTNHLKRGDNWERLAHLTLQTRDQNQTALSSVVGIRLNDFPLNLLGEKNNYRLYFRKRYGLKSVPQVFFQKNTKVPEQFGANILDIEFVRHDLSKSIRRYAAYEIAGMSGCTTSQSRFAEIVINEKSFGPALVTAKISERAIGEIIEPGTFALVEHAPGFSIADFISHNPLLPELSLKNKASAQKRVIRLIDYDNFSRYIFVLAFLGVSAGDQQTLLHPTTDGLKLKWIISELPSDLLWGDDVVDGTIPQTWNQPGLMPFVLPMNTTHDTGIIFSRLLKKSSEFNRKFVDLAVHLLNHELRPEKILKKLQSLPLVEMSVNPQNTARYTSIRKYLEYRIDFLRGELQQLPGVGEFVSFQINGPTGTDYKIDGFDELSGYTGRYFSNQKVRVSLSHPGDRQRLSHWLVNGESFDSKNLVLHLNKNTLIEPVFCNF